MDMDISMDIRAKSVDMDMDVDGKFHIHGNPGLISEMQAWTDRQSDIDKQRNHSTMNKSANLYIVIMITTFCLTCKWKKIVYSLTQL